MKMPWFTFFGTDEDTKKKPTTLFYTNFIMMLFFSVFWFYFFASYYLGKPTIYDAFVSSNSDFSHGFETMKTIVILIGWTTPLIFLRQTIHYYKIIKYGVKAGWK